MNISEIAKLAGVSSASVSRYFNHGYLSEEKRKAIEQVVSETGYHPSVQAQMLRTKKTKMVGVIAPKMVATSIGSMVEGILSVLNERDYHMLLALSEGKAEKEISYLSAFDSKQVDGVLLMGTTFTSAHKKTLSNMSVPIVIMGQQLDGYSCVFHDDYHAVYDITMRFWNLGRRNLAYISAFHEDIAAGKKRYMGYCDAVRNVGDPELADNYVIADFTVDSGYEMVKELMERCPEINGLVCASDEMATGAIQYFKECHINVPEDIIVSGIGDSQIAKMANPSLLTAHFSYHTCGSMATEMLLEKILDETTEEKEVMLGYHILENRAR